MDRYVKVLKQYVDSSGRARSREYWMFVLINVVIVIVLLVFYVLEGTRGPSRFGPDPKAVEPTPAY